MSTVALANLAFPRPRHGDRGTVRHGVAGVAGVDGMNLFPPSGYSQNPLDGTDPQWTRWFAWYPVTINVYKVSEIENGKLSYRVWMRWVECRLRPDGPPPDDFPQMQFRLPS